MEVVPGPSRGAAGKVTKALGRRSDEDSREIAAIMADGLRGIERVS